MVKKALQLGFCFLVLAALATGPSVAIPSPHLTYTQTGVGGSMERACEIAVQEIKNDCDIYGPITTDPGYCRPLLGPDDEVIGRICTCEATTTSCGIIRF